MLYKLGYIFSASDSGESSSIIESRRPAFLFLLGTDTVYTPEPSFAENPAWYRRGETLSYAAQLIAQGLGERPVLPHSDFKKPVALSSDSVTVINGPTTFGSEVGDRIARGVFFALKAVCNGQLDLFILGHSRGAVEGMLVMHELERIKQALEIDPDKTLYQILQETPCERTKKAVSNLFADSEKESKEQREFLLTQLNQLKLNSFLIDPVPGGNRFKYGGWRDKAGRFYAPLPEGNHHMMIARDERSGAFKPVIPEGINPAIIPGHHGSASGNLFDQQYSEAKKKNQQYNAAQQAKQDKRALAQDIVLFKLLFFLEARQIFPENFSVNTSMPLDEVAERYFATRPSDRPQLIASCYETILSVDPVFREFEKTTYSSWVLGIENLLGQRIVHYRAHVNVPLYEMANYPGGYFFNTEHAEIFLESYLGRREARNTTIRNIRDTIYNAHRELVTTSPESPSHRKKLAEVIRHELLHQKFFDGVSLLMDACLHQYFSSSKSEFRSRVDEIPSPILVLRDYISGEDPPTDNIDNERLIAWENTLVRTIEHTTNQHYKALCEQDFALRKKISYKRLSEEDFVGMVLVSSSNTSLENTDSFLRHLEQSNTTPEQLENLHKEIDLYRQAREVSYDNLLEEENKLKEKIRELDTFVKAFERQNVELQWQFTHGELEQFLSEAQDEVVEVSSVQDNGLPPSLERQSTMEQQDDDLETISSRDSPLTPPTEEDTLPVAGMRPADYSRHNDTKRFSPEPQAVDDSVIKLLKTLVESYEKRLEKEKDSELKTKKLNIINELGNKLNNSPASLTEFQKKLETSTHDLNLHRDSGWLRFCKNCAIILAIVCTGIVPGALGLAIYASKTNQSPFFFAKSHGERLVNKCNDILNKNVRGLK